MQVRKAGVPVGSGLCRPALIQDEVMLRVRKHSRAAGPPVTWRWPSSGAKQRKGDEREADTSPPELSEAPESPRDGVGCGETPGRGRLLWRVGKMWVSRPKLSLLGVSPAFPQPTIIVWPERRFSSRQAPLSPLPALVQCWKPSPDPGVVTGGGGMSRFCCRYFAIWSVQPALFLQCCSEEPRSTRGLSLSWSLNRVEL